MFAKVSALYHYPVKGLSPQALRRVDLVPGKGFPFDRVYGLARHDSGYDPDKYAALPKARFIVVVNEERLPGLSTLFDVVTKSLEIRVQGQVVLQENLEDEIGRDNVVAFFANMFDLDEARRPMLAVGGEMRFTDISIYSERMMNGISLINLATVRDFEGKIDATINPLRFRANLYLDGLPPYSELDLLEREIEVGSARLRIFRRTRRCAATNVDPVTAERDLALPRMLMEHLGHADMGVYAEVIEGGPIELGSSISVL